MTLIIEDFSGDETLLVVNSGILFSHVSQDSGLGRNLPLHRPSLGQEGLDLRTILLYVVIVDVTFPVHVEDWWLVQVAYETKCSALYF